MSGPKDTEPEDVYLVSFADYEKFLPYMYATERAKTPLPPVPAHRAGNGRLYSEACRDFQRGECKFGVHCRYPHIQIASSSSSLASASAL